jgi:hypothetical protein
MSSEIAIANANLEDVRHPDSTTRFARRVLITPGKENRILEAVCINHKRLSPVSVCTNCEVPLCLDCVRTVGNLTAFICESCGSHCLPFSDVERKVRLLIDQRTGFGASDFKLALLFPFRETVVFFFLSLVYGISLYTVPFLSPNARAMLWGVLGFLPAFISTSVLFGCTSAVIDRIEQGRTDTIDLLDTTSMLAAVPEIAVRGLGLLIALFWPGLIAYSIGLPDFIGGPLMICWPLFYYPMALGSMTLFQSPWAPINPLTGLRVLARLKSNGIGFYVRYLSIASITGGVILILNLVIAPQGFGLVEALLFAIPAGSIFCYANAITAYLLGRALFKAGYR